MDENGRNDVVVFDVTRSVSVPKYIIDAVDGLMRSDRKIHAVKLLRSYVYHERPEATFFGLKEAKDYVESLYPDSFPAPGLVRVDY